MTHDLGYAPNRAMVDESTAHLAVSIDNSPGKVCSGREAFAKSPFSEKLFEVLYLDVKDN
jgi:hypothetical protein